MSTVRLKFLFKELRFVRLWNVWTRRSGVNTVRRYLRERSVRDVIQCFKYTILRPRRTLLLSAAAYKFNDDSGLSCEQGISNEELQSLLLELDNVQQLAKLTLYCTCCGNRIVIDRKQEGVQYCGCKEPKPAEDSSDGWFPYMETDDVIIWRKEYKPGKGLYAYKVYGRYPDVLASDYAAVQLDGAYRRVWDSAVAALAVVERDARGVTGQTVLHWEVLWPRLFANRDYVYIRRHAELEVSRDRVFVIMSRSCDHPAVPETKHAIRVTEYWSHMVVKALSDESGTEFVLTYYDEPATGGMPCGVAAWASSRAAPVYLARMRRAALAYRRWAADEAQVPSSEQEWKQISREFEIRWNFPHCIGAIDGKHVLIVAPNNSGSEYYNYKNQFSIVLLAIADGNYNFIYANCGAKGRSSDSGIFQKTPFYNALLENSLKLPRPEPITQGGPKMPFIIVGDSAFALTENIMKPYPGIHEHGNKKRIFNYRLSRARRIIENVFGILCVVFRVFTKPIPLKPANCELVVIACVYLHNFLRRNSVSRSIYTPPQTFDFEDSEGNLLEGSWRRELGSLPMTDLQRWGRPASQSAFCIREQFADYFISPEGSVPWQNNIA